MTGTEWVYAAIAALLFAHLLTLLYAYRVNQSESSFDAASTEETTGSDDVTRPRNLTGSEDPSVCRCPECGTENDSTYRFCRQCVAELPAANLHIEHPGRQQQPY